MQIINILYLPTHNSSYTTNNKGNSIKIIANREVSISFVDATVVDENT